ncbi:hypothetical protein [Bacillus cereus group sp. BfR-BA-01361]|uniref:hypothetical protein n=1 Tax=Bacillus cereus group sp. BfR-BA-01361 TaxID=2920322 RepID=UPI001F59D8EA|nr:hypothetical protein [Bacillus cereus group sp. BfR-BA-01361]
MKMVGIGATTHVDKQNMRITKEALEKAAEDIQKGKVVPAMKIEHDTILPPIGKVTNGKVEKREDGEYQLVITQELFNNVSDIKLPDGSTGILESLTSDNRPFAMEGELELSSDLKISVDYANFESHEEYIKFRQEIKQAGEYEEGIISRKSFIPDPEMIIAISKLVLASTFGKKVVEKLSDKVIDDGVPKANEVIKKAVSSMARYCIPKNRPITYVFLIPGTFDIKLVVRTNEPNKAVAAILQENLVEVLEKAKELHETLDANEIQFLLSEEGEWEFNFLLTNTGAVIGTPESYHKREKRIQLMYKQLEEKEKE